MESIHEILELKPYGVLGKQKLSTDTTKVIEKGDDPANMDSCVIVDCGNELLCIVILLKDSFPSSY